MVVPPNVPWFPLNVRVAFPFLLNIPVPVIAFVKVRSVERLNSRVPDVAIFVEPPKYLSVDDVWEYMRRSLRRLFR